MSVVIAMGVVGICIAVIAAARMGYLETRAQRMRHAGRAGEH